MIGLRSLATVLLVAIVVVPGGARAVKAQEVPGESRGGLLEFVASRAERKWEKVPRRVLAFYYTWYGTPEHHGRWVHWNRVDAENHEISASTHYPALGAYDSHDPQTIDAHIDLAKKAGVDGFICTWWGQGTFDDRALVTVLERTAKKDFSIGIYWETAPGNDQAQVDRAVADLSYVLQRYGAHPAFLKVDGKPVIFVYGRVMDEVATPQWPAIISEVERRNPGGVVLIADGYNQRNARLFDGIHTYNICGWVQGKELDALREITRPAFAEPVQLARQNSKIACITVIPGYDDTKIRKPGINALRHDGGTYRVLWEEAIRSDPDWVLITSWNEWHEGSEIEPSWEDGDKYVQLTGEYARRFKQTTFSTAPTDMSHSRLAGPKVEELKRLFHEHPIGVLPDFSGDVVFWLSENGVPLRELAWSDVVRPERFNAADYPVVVYAGYEEYRQTVRTKADVDQHLVRIWRKVDCSSYSPADRHRSSTTKRGNPWRLPADWECRSAAVMAIPGRRPSAGSRHRTVCSCHSTSTEKPCRTCPRTSCFPPAAINGGDR